MPRLLAVPVLALALLAQPGCASLMGHDPPHVSVVGIEPQEGQGQGFEMRLLVKLRVQNPNDAPIEYNGVSLEMSVRGKSFATGVSDAAGSVPRFGEAVIPVPITISAFSMLTQAYELFRNGASGSINYEMKGRLGSGFSSTHFKTQGEFTLPASAAAPAS